MDFVPVQIPVLPSFSGYTKRNIIFRPEKSYRTEIDQDFQIKKKSFRSNEKIMSLTLLPLSFSECHRHISGALFRRSPHSSSSSSSSSLRPRRLETSFVKTQKARNLFLQFCSSLAFKFLLVLSSMHVPTLLLPKFRVPTSDFE